MKTNVSMILERIVEVYNFYVFVFLYAKPCAAHGDPAAYLKVLRDENKL